MNTIASTLDLIGNTPLVRLNGPSADAGCDIFGKCEYVNPGASVKDRAALYIVRDAERQGLLKPGGTIVEGTAGNTGIGLALVCNALGYKTIIVMPETQSQEKKDTLRALGAEAIVPGRGEAMLGNTNVNKSLDYTKRWVETLFACGKQAVAGNLDLKAAMALTRQHMDPVFGKVFIYEHCLPFDVSRAYDEAKGIKHPRIWTAERDKEMWSALQA
jgi:hypothetical protein